MAAALDGTLEVKNSESIKDHIKSLVVLFGSTDRLVNESESSSWGRSKRKKYTDETPIVEISAEELFVIPESYIEAKKKWDENVTQIEQDLHELEGVKDTVLLKVNVGSDKALEGIIAQADTLATLDLVNRQLSSGVDKLLKS